MSRLTPEFLSAIAAFRRYDFPERLPAWQERFAMGLPDLEQVFEQAVSGAPVFEAPGAAQTERHAPGRYHAQDATTDLFAASAVQIAERVRARAQSPMEIARLFLHRIEAHASLNAFITVKPDLVMQEAEVLEKRAKRGEDLGPLAGVPVGIKDLMPVRGHPLTAGTRALEAKVQDHDAPVVARLRAAGALIVGTCNLHELAFGVTSANPHFGHVGNPRFPGRVPGGSSGGSAAAVAASLAAIAVGSCTGGSIRMPAACCGIVGFKPTYDAVPRDEVHPLAWTLDHIGPLTRSVEDAALAFEVMAGVPEHSSLPREASMPPRVMLPRKYFYDRLQPEVRKALEQAFARLRDAGAVFGEVDVPGIELAPGIQLLTINGEAAQANGELLRRAGDRMGEDVRVRLELGQFYLASDYIKAQQLRAKLRQAMIDGFGSAEVMIVPAMPVLPPKAGEATVDIDGQAVPVTPALTRFTSPLNFCGFPALSMPCGTSPSGLPVNIQVVGRPGADATVLRVARWCERVLA